MVSLESGSNVPEHFTLSREDYVTYCRLKRIGGMVLNASRKIEKASGSDDTRLEEMVNKVFERIHEGVDTLYELRRSGEDIARFPKQLRGVTPLLNLDLTIPDDRRLDSNTKNLLGSVPNMTRWHDDVHSVEGVEYLNYGFGIQADTFENDIAVLIRRGQAETHAGQRVMYAMGLSYVSRAQELIALLPSNTEVSDEMQVAFDRAREL